MRKDMALTLNRIRPVRGEETPQGAPAQRVSSPSAETPHESTCLKVSHLFSIECAKREAVPEGIPPSCTLLFSALLFSSFLFFVSRCQHFRPFCLHFRLKCRHPPGSTPLSLYYGKIPSVFHIPFHPTYRTFGVSSPSAETSHESTCLKASHSLPRECAKRSPHRRCPLSGFPRRGNIRGGNSQ